MSNSTLGSWNIKAFIDNRQFTPPDHAKSRYEEAFFRMDIGSTLDIDGKDYYEVTDITATWRISHNFDYEIYFKQVQPPTTASSSGSRLPPPKENNQDIQPIEIDRDTVEFMFFRDATFIESNLSKGDTLIISAIEYKILHTRFQFDNETANYWIYQVCLRP
ncbi:MULTISPECIES: hypothetical protein [Pseudomonas]|uniref:Uncharacterized protein n=1 Tax=Pseudomonas fluorescens TaxID=294 RepID=A0A0N9WVJ3_PSEFL|nr:MULTISPECIES: hypothetical protein [Pseudomonas]ALI06894.1 hypothetical protein AO356_08775 [Pseudomonas fluorescens]POA11719.1 hypothetical protein C1892_24825 [Pseudomonas sp. MPBD7-1]